MSDIHIYVRRIELSKERRNSNFQSIYFVNKLGEIFSFIHCHVAWRICGLQGGSGEIQKGLTKDSNFHTIWLVSIIGKTFGIRIALWPDYFVHVSF